MFHPLLLLVLFFDVIHSKEYQQNTSTVKDLVHIDRGVDVFYYDGTSGGVVVDSGREGMLVRVVIGGEAYENTFVCRNGSLCVFECAGGLGYCLKNTFKCQDGSNCSVLCSPVMSCIHLTLECTSLSTCSVKCNPKDACWDLRQDCDNSSSCLVVDQSYFVNNYVALKVKTAILEVFVMNNVRVNNLYATVDGTVQVLSNQLPLIKDQSSFINTIKADLNRVSVYHRVGLNFSNFNFDFPKPYLLIMTLAESELDAEITKAANTSFVFWNMFLPALLNDSNANVYDYGYVESVHVTKGTLLLVIRILKKLPISENEIKSGNNAFVNMNMMNLFELPDDVDLIITTSIITNHTIITNTTLKYKDCEPPIPFYGAYCFNSSWTSRNYRNLSYDDLILKSSDHEGTMQAGNITFEVSATNFTVRSNLVIKSSNFTVNTSNIKISEALLLNNSVVNFITPASIQTLSLNLQNSVLVLRLDNTAWKTILSNKQSNIPIFTDFNSSSGFFNNITLPGFSEVLDGTGCTASVMQEIHLQKFHIVISLDCPNINNEFYIITSVIICLAVVGVGSAIALTYFNFFKKDEGMKEMAAQVERGLTQ